MCKSSYIKYHRIVGNVKKNSGEGLSFTIILSLILLTSDGRGAQSKAGSECGQPFNLEPSMDPIFQSFNHREMALKFPARNHCIFNTHPRFIIQLSMLPNVEIEMKRKQLSVISPLVILIVAQWHNNSGRSREFPRKTTALLLALIYCLLKWT